MAAKNKLLTVLSEAEQYALYGLPDFDDDQQLEYLALSETELMLAASKPDFMLRFIVFCKSVTSRPSTHFSVLTGAM